MGLLYLWAGGNFFSLPWKHGDGRSVVHWQVGEDERKADDRGAHGNKRVQVVPWGALQQAREVLLRSAVPWGGTAGAPHPVLGYPVPGRQGMAGESPAEGCRDGGGLEHLLMGTG